MNNGSITAKQMLCIVFLFLLGSLSSVGSLNIGHDECIILIFGFVISIPLIFCYAHTLNLYPGSGLFEIFVTVFGKAIGKIFIAFYIFYALMLGGFVFRAYSEFIKITSLPYTPQIVIRSFMAVICIWMAKSGIKCIARISRFIIPLFVFFMLFFALLAIGNVHPKYFLPILTTPLSTITKYSVIHASLPLCETVILGVIFSSVKQKVKPFKIYFCAVALITAVLIIICLRILLILGASSASSYNFPSFETINVSSPGNLFTRGEVLVGISYTIAGSIKTALCIYIAAKGISAIPEFPDSNVFAAPAALIMLVFAEWDADNATQFFHAMYIYPYIVFIFQVILPIITLVTAEIKTKLCGGNNTKPTRQ